MKNIKILFSCSFCFTMICCNNSNNNDITNKETIIDYPIEIPFTDYSLSETSCQWINFESNKVIIINSDEKLIDYIVCTDNDYPKIDFLDHSLLLISGMASGSPADVIEIELQQILVNEYALHLKVRPGPAATPGRWYISIIIPKILQDAIITLNVQQINY